MKLTADAKKDTTTESQRRVSSRRKDKKKLHKSRKSKRKSTRTNYRRTYRRTYRKSKLRKNRKLNRKSKRRLMGGAAREAREAARETVKRLRERQQENKRRAAGIVEADKELAKNRKLHRSALEAWDRKERRGQAPRNIEFDIQMVTTHSRAPGKLSLTDNKIQFSPELSMEDVHFTNVRNCNYDRSNKVLNLEVYAPDHRDSSGGVRIIQFKTNKHILLGREIMRRAQRHQTNTPSVLAPAAASVPVAVAVPVAVPAAGTEAAEPILVHADAVYTADN